MNRRIVMLVAAVLGSLCARQVDAEPTSHRQKHQHVAARLQSIHDSSPGHQQRVERVSGLFLGKPFALSPLGEGPTGRVDQDPIVRFDRFDCVTYVEEVMALSWHADLNHAVRDLQRVRYASGTVRYGARKHIMMAQWIPLNIAAGFVHDITRIVGGDATESATLQLAAQDFRSKKGGALKLAAADQPRGSYSVPLLPLARMAGALDRVPAGTIITTIRRAQSQVPYRASHVGLVIIRDGKRVIRHAHKPSRRVVEQPLATFVAAAARFRSWPVVGFNFMAIASRPPR
jgi:hypothetical protein